MGVSTRHCLASVCAAKIQQTPFLANTLSTLTSLNGTWYKYCIVMTTVDQGMGALERQRRKKTISQYMDHLHDGN